MTMTAEQLAQIFHDHYERLAPEFGYTTRLSSAQPWSEVPEPNKSLMIATARAVMRELGIKED
jgi:di/tripeptidase